KLWSTPEKWPFDAPRHVFMARAVDLLGRGQADWPAEAKDIRASPHFDGVAAQIREHCAFGRLVAYLQHSDGRFEAMPAEAWNTHAYQGWFSNFFRAPANVIPRRWHPLADIPEWWLFVGRAELEALATPPASYSGPESNAASDSAPSIYHVHIEDIRGLPFLFLGQAIEWIGARGEPIEDADLAAKWDADERELFDCLDATAQDVQGYPANGPCIYESLPSGIWARMNRGGTNDP
ncbi:hypothetical protein HFK74_33020, partial|uniref:hypothetical protein n=1 Tax=Pseudomonas sp. SbOxS1 TaxID=2723884 RepID=UPI0015D3507F